MISYMAKKRIIMRKSPCILIKMVGDIVFCKKVRRYKKLSGRIYRLTGNV